MLNDASFMSMLKMELHLYLQENANGTVNPSMLWDAFKAVLRGKIIAWSASSKKIKRLQLLELEEKLKNLEQIYITNRDHDVIKQIRLIKQDIDKILSEEVEKKLRFMKQRYYEAGPKASKLLAWRLKKQQAENTVHKIKDPVTNSIVKNLDDIQKAFEKYYTLLYSNKDQTDTQTITTFLNSLDLPNIGTQINEKLTQPITREEISEAILSLNNNKSPSVDGFHPEWYKTMRENLVPLLDKCFNYILEDGSPPPSWREAFISVIPKEGKDRMDCKGYRPISVLNADYKLYATILTKRMETAMHDLIDEDQTGFIRNRQAQDNIRRSFHIIENINKTQSGAIILSLDAEMAFDSVGWNFLYLVMKRFGFGNKFISCIQTLYSSPIARVRINGSLSDPIGLERGCRQGCPASPSLFNLFIEPLAPAIRQETKLTGISIGGEEYKVSLYADDVLVTLSNPATGLPILMDMLETYGKYSGYVLNLDKTQVMIFNFAPTQELKTI